jgi:hypothetical protein
MLWNPVKTWRSPGAVCLYLDKSLALQVRRRAITSHNSKEAWQRFWVLPEQRLHSLHRDVRQRLNLQLASFDPGLCKATAQ